MEDKKRHSTYRGQRDHHLHGETAEGIIDNKLNGAESEKSVFWTKESQGIRHRLSKPGYFFSLIHEIPT